MAINQIDTPSKGLADLDMGKESDFVGTQNPEKLAGSLLDQAESEALGLSQQEEAEPEGEDYLEFDSPDEPEQLEAKQEEPEEQVEAAQEEESYAPNEGSRADKRIQGLVNDKKELSEQNRLLQERFEKLLEQMSKSTEIQSSQFELQKSLYEKQKPSDLQMWNEAIIKAGLNPEDTMTQFAFELSQDIKQLKSQFEEKSRELNEIRNRQVFETYEQKLASALKKGTDKYSVDEEGMHEIIEHALEVAQVRGLDPDKAAEVTLKRFGRFLKPKVKAESETPNVHRAINSTGRSGGARPGKVRIENSLQGIMDAWLGS